jgi:hypothetical protein
MADHEDEPITFDQLRLNWYCAYISELSDIAEILRDTLIEDLEKIRTTLPNECRTSDRRKFEEELLDAQTWLPVLKERTRAAVLMAKAAEANQKALMAEETQKFEADHKNALAGLDRINFSTAAKIAFSKMPDRFRQTFKMRADLNARARKAAEDSARNANSAVRKALHWLRARAIIRWILERASYIGWSLVGCVILIDLFNDYTSHGIVQLLHRLMPDLAKDTIEALERVCKYTILVGIWLIVDNRLKSRLEHWQNSFELKSVRQFASDVVNARFAVRIARTLTHAAYLGAKDFADDPDTARDTYEKFLPSWHRRIPRIEELESLNLAPLPVVAKEMKALIKVLKAQESEGASP